MSPRGGGTFPATRLVSYRLILVGFVLAVLLAVACDQPAAESPHVPEPDMTDMEPQVEKRLRKTRSVVLANPQSADAWGRFGMVTHAHELWDEAQTAYRQAEKLDPTDERWPYYLGDVLSVLGTDLEAAEQAFRRALELRLGYAPAHLRLGNTLVLRDRIQAAAAQFERALELEPKLQPARVALAQIRLSEGQLELSEELLAEVLAAAPRHGRALSTLAQVYMRQDRRAEAREIAAQVRSAARYNLFSDPLMGQVDSEGRSAVVLWERAKAFFDNGNYEQAARGLLLVVELQPSNADAHQQLAVAYGNLGNLERSRYYLERTVTLKPHLVEPRLQLATVHLEQQNPTAAVEQLRRALELAPDDPDAGWLLGKAQVLAGDLSAGLTSFEQSKVRGLAVPVWAHNEWGSALAQAGAPAAARDHFLAALAADADNAQALFYLGLLLEGSGHTDAAVEHYCRSLEAQAKPSTLARLQALGRACG